MEIKTTEALRVAYIEDFLTIADIRERSRTLGARIYDEVQKQQAGTSGGWVFIAHNLPKNGKTKFRIQFCLPVTEVMNESGDVKVQELKAVRCLSSLYEGSMRSLFTKGYAPLVNRLKSEAMPVTGESRELYHSWNGPSASDNRIEIQFMLA